MPDQATNNTTVQKKRQEIFKEHTDLIQIGLKLDAIAFCEQIRKLTPLPEKENYQNLEDFPQLHETSLFSIVLNHNKIDAPTKRQLLDHLLENVGYDHYQKELVYTSLLKILLDPEFYSILKGLFFIHYDYIPYDIEVDIWESLLRRNEEALSLFAALLVNTTDPEKHMNFIKHWLNTIDSKSEVMRVCNIVLAYIVSSSRMPAISHYQNEIMKIAQMRILTIMLENQSTEEKENKIDSFLKSTQSILHYLSRSYSSHDIYQMIRSNHSEANKLYNKKCEDSEKIINDKLTDELGRNTYFTFR